MFFSLLVILVVLGIFFYRRHQKKHADYWKHLMAIPGPKSIPILGTDYELHTAESLFETERQRCIDYFPVYKAWTFAAGIVFLITPEDIELVLTNSIHNSKGIVYDFLRPWLGDGILLKNGPKWHSRRKLLTPAFHFNILQEFTGMLNTETELLVEHLKKLCHQPYVDVVGPITEFTLYAIGETSLGVPLRDDPKCDEYKKAVLDYGYYFSYRVIRPWFFLKSIYQLSPTYQRDKMSVKIMHDFSSNVINERKKELRREGSFPERKKLALLDLMLKAKLSGADVDDQEIREEMDTFIFAGHDTTSLSICYTLLLLANNPEIQEEMYQEIISTIGSTEAPTYATLGELKYMERCIKESLRLFPSAPVISRIVGEDIKVKSGYTIPKDCNVAICIYDMHRNPSVWEDPEKFDPDRFLPENIAKRHAYSYIPFSAGSRNCIGQKYAMLELKTALCGIVRNFKLEAFDRMVHVKHKMDIVLRPSDEIRVKFVPRM